MPMIRWPHHIAVGMPGRVANNGHGQHEANVPSHEADYNEADDDQAPHHGQGNIDS